PEPGRPRGRTRMPEEAANAAEAAAWKAARGQQWVRLQPDLDLTNAGVTAALLDAAAPQPGERVLDIGCGAGATSLAVADRVGAGGGVLGVDISDPLIARARERAQGRAGVDFLIADAQT